MTHTPELTEAQREERRARARTAIESGLRDTVDAWHQTPPRLDWAADAALDALGDLAAEILVDGTMMRSLTIRDGVATLELAEATELVQIFAAGMRGVLVGNGASNYVEMEMVDGATGDAFTVTVQRRGNPTPHQFRQQAEARLAEATAELEETRAALTVAREVLGTTGEQPEPPVTEARPVETEWVIETLWRNGEWRRHWPTRATRYEADQDYERSVCHDPKREYRVARVETTCTVEPSPVFPADTEDPS